MNKDEEIRLVDKRDLRYINTESDPARREKMICAVTSYRRPDKLHIGDSIPQLELAQLHGNGKTILAIHDKPLVLIFGSYT